MRRIVMLALVWGCGGGGGEDGGGDDDDDAVGDDDDTVIGDDDDDDTVAPPGELAGGRLCTERGWCWETPDPAGGSMSGVWAVTPDDVWAASQTHLFRLGADGIEHASAPTLTPYLNWMPVFGVAPDDVWSHGFTSFIHWDGHVWSDLGTGTYSSSIHGLAADDLWSSGFSTIHHWDGSSWSVRVSDPEFTDSYVDVWATGPDQAIVGGYDGAVGKVWRVDGDRLTDLAFPGTANRIVIGVFAPSADEVWAVGGDGVWRLADGTWTRMADDSASVDVWGSGPDDVWTVSQWGGAVRHWDGVSMSQETMPDATYPARMTGFGDQGDLWVSDSNGAVHVRSGGTWSSVKRPLTTSTVADLAMDETGTVWAVAPNGILRRDTAGAWTSEPSPAEFGLTGIAELGGEVYVFGLDATWKQGPTDWQPTLNGGGLTDACELDDGTVLGVGSVLATLEGSEWVEDDTLPRVPLGRVICHGDEAFATSTRSYDPFEDTSELLRWGDGSWRHVGLRSVLGEEIAAAFAPEPDATWVVTASDVTGLAMGWDGSAWEEVPLSFEPLGVGGTSATDVWFVGTGGVARLTATGLAEVADAPFAEFRWVASDGRGAATFVTRPGAVWIYDPTAGVRWREVVPAGAEIEDVAVSDGVIYAVNNWREALRLQPAGWVELPGSFSADQVEANDDAGVWFVDLVGRLGHWDGANVVEVASSVPGTLYVPSTGTDVLAFGYSGEVSVLGGSTFAQESDRPMSSLVATFGSSLDDLWVIGEDDATRNARIDHRDAGRWAEHQEIVQPLAVGESPSGDELWIDATQAIWRRADGGFEQLFPPGPVGLDYPASGAVIRDTNDAWVTTLGGVLHWNGTWDTLAEPLGLGFYGMAETEDGTAWALGSYGWIASLEP